MILCLGPLLYAIDNFFTSPWMTPDLVKATSGIENGIRRYAFVRKSAQLRSEVPLFIATWEQAENTYYDYP